MQEDYYVISSFEMLFESSKALANVWNAEIITAE